MAQAGEAEVGTRQAGGDAGAVEEVGVALCRGEHARGLAVGLAEEAVGGAGDQPAGAGALLHQPEQRAEPVRRQGQVLAQGGEGAAVLGLVDGGEEDQAGEERLGLLVPVSIPGLARRVHDQGFSKRGGVLAEVEAVGREAGERIIGGGRQAGDAEGIEDMDRPEPGAGLVGDPGVLALGVDDQHRAGYEQQVGDHGAHALAGPGGGEGQQMRGAVVAQQTAAVGVAADQEAALAFGESAALGFRGEAGGAVAVAGAGKEPGNAEMLGPE